MVAVHISISGKKENDKIGKFTIATDILKREDANEIECQYAKLIEKILQESFAQIAIGKFKTIKIKESAVQAQTGAI
jgi:hypothetical protein